MTTQRIPAHDAEMQRLNLLKKNHMDEQYVARRNVRDLPGVIESMTDRLDNLTADAGTLARLSASILFKLAWKLNR